VNSTPADEHKFLELVNGNRNRILKVCRVYAWNPSDQEDLYQEILFQIWRALPGLKENNYANTWLYRIAINTSISFTRKRAARGGRALQLDHAELTRHIEAGQAHDGQQGDNLAKLYEAIAQLDAVERALITLFLEDLSYEQIADVLGVSANNVGVMLHRAKKKLSALVDGGSP
jgi:RNA polymerase sigma-70 factor (ECF subfamily)